MPLLNDELRPTLVAALPTSRKRLSLALDAVPPALAFMDVACVVILGITSGIAYNLVESGRIGDLSRYFGFGIALAISFSSLAYARGLYSRQSGLRIKEAMLIWTGAFLCLVVLMIVLKGDDFPPRGTVLLSFAAGVLGVSLLRWGTRQVLAQSSRSGRITKRQVVVVSRYRHSVPASLAQAIEASGRNVCRTFSLPVSSGEWEISECMRQIIDYVRHGSVDEILLALDWTDTTLIEEITGQLSVVPLPVALVPDSATSTLLEHPLFGFGDTKAVQLQRPPLNRPQLAAKRLLDLVLSVLALPVVLPALAIIAALVVCDSPGPVFFRQRRVGFNNRPFYIYKFRTMRTLEDGAAIQQAGRDDKRVTRVGRILRRFSIDELPQLLNVLRGEMSLVGPRPHALAHDNEYREIIAFYAARHNVKPGITGWAQVNGWRGGTPDVQMMIRRVECDLWYVNHWSLGLDLKILVLTAVCVCNAQNAY